MATKKKEDLHWIHRQAGLASQFEAQDEGVMGSLDYTSILGKLPDQDVWIVLCQFTVTDAVADGSYWWPMEKHLAVYKREDGEPSSRHATDEEVALFEE